MNNHGILIRNYLGKTKKEIKNQRKIQLPRYVRDRISFASPRVFADAIRGRQSSRFAHWIMKEGPERWKWTLDPRFSFFGSDQGATLFADPLDLRLSISRLDRLDAAMQDLHVASRVNHWYVPYIARETWTKWTFYERIIKHSPRQTHRKQKYNDERHQFSSNE